MTITGLASCHRSARRCSWPPPRDWRRQATSAAASLTRWIMSAVAAYGTWVNRYSRTAQTFHRRDRFDGELIVQPSGSNDPGFLHRLSWRITPKVPTDWGALIEAIGSETQIDVFCDTSTFSDDAPDALWEALLAEEGRLVITPRVWEELKPWLKIRPGQALWSAIGERSSGIGFSNDPKPGETGRRVYEYYTSLLRLRRAVGAASVNIFRKTHGRDPDADEARELLAEIQKNLGERGRLLAGKPSQVLTDEALVYLAVTHAIRTGRQTMVLTRDADVEEQFLKLLWLLETHYRGMLLADVYASSTGAFRTSAIPAHVLEDPNGPFEPSNGVLVDRDPFMRNILPRNPHFVAVSCWNVGRYCSSLAFGAEMEMSRLLDIKESTNGLSTNLLAGRNMHASVSPTRIGGTTDHAAIVHDRRKTISPDGTAAAVLDGWQALVAGERHGSFIEKGPDAG
jgi:hypothetical protein